MPDQKILDPIDKLLGESWTFFKKNSDKLISIALIMVSPGLVSQILNIVLEDSDNIILAIISGLLGLVSLITGLWGAVTLINFIQAKKPQMTVSEAFNTSVPYLWSYAWVGFLIFLIVFAGILLLVVPGIVWAVNFSLFGYIMISENKKGFAAARRSKELIKGYWWPVFGRYFVAFLIYFILTMLISALQLKPNLYSLGTLLLSIFVSPLLSVYAYRLYQNLVEIKK